VNYDCDIGHFNAIEKIVELLGKIAQGKYAKAEYSLVILPEQGCQLRNLALEGLFQMLLALEKFSEELEKENLGKEEGKINENIQIFEANEQNIILNDPNEQNAGNIIDPEKYSH